MFYNSSITLVEWSCVQYAVYWTDQFSNYPLITFIYAVSHLYHVFFFFFYTRAHTPLTQTVTLQFGKRAGQIGNIFTTTTSMSTSGLFLAEQTIMSLSKTCGFTWKAKKSSPWTQRIHRCTWGAGLLLAEIWTSNLIQAAQATSWIKQPYNYSLSIWKKKSASLPRAVHRRTSTSPHVWRQWGTCSLMTRVTRSIANGFTLSHQGLQCFTSLQQRKNEQRWKQQEKNWTGTLFILSLWRTPVSILCWRVQLWWRGQQAVYVVAMARWRVCALSRSERTSTSTDVGGAVVDVVKYEIIKLNYKYYYS